MVSHVLQKERRLSFRPINARNAVLEGIVVLVLDRALTPPEADAIRASHPRFQLDLPRLEEMPGISMFVGSGQPPWPPLHPFSMAAYQRDGSLESRLLFNANLLAANFLAYSHWEEHWGKALLWFREVKDAILKAQQVGEPVPPPRVAAVGHQMIDVFPWEGDQMQASASVLIKNAEGRLPDMGLRATGQTWSGAHTFTTPASIGEGNSPKTALLDALSYDLGPEHPLGWRFRLDHLQETRLQDSQALESTLGGESPLASRFVSKMHARNRDLVSALLSETMLRAIGLNRT